MVISEVIVNICSGNSALGDGVDDGRWTGYAVASCEDAFHAFHSHGFVCVQFLPENGYASLFKYFRVDFLTDRAHDDVALKDLFFFLSREGFRTSG